MSSVVDVVAEHIIAAGVVGTWRVFAGFEPPTPDRTIAVIEFAGQPPDTSFTADYPAFQVRVRAAQIDYVLGRSKAQEVLDAIHAQAIVGTSVSPADYLVYAIADQQPYPVDRDDQDRLTFAFNCRSMRAP